MEWGRATGWKESWISVTSHRRPNPPFFNFSVRNELQLSLHHWLFRISLKASEPTSKPMPTFSSPPFVLNQGPVFLVSLTLGRKISSSIINCVCHTISFAMATESAHTSDWVLCKQMLRSSLRCKMFRTDGHHKKKQKEAELGRENSWTMIQLSTQPQPTQQGALEWIVPNRVVLHGAAWLGLYIVKYLIFQEAAESCEPRSCSWPQAMWLTPGWGQSPGASI